MRGYAGYYKGTYLRSSREYCMAKYLDFRKIPWKYESERFYFSDGTPYKPDFFLENGVIVGDKNPMYGVKHSAETKAKISKKAKERFATGKYDYLTQNMIEHNRATNYADAKKPRAKRVTIYCKNIQCKKPFEVTVAESKKRKYCSSECANPCTSQEARNKLKDKKS